MKTPLVAINLVKTEQVKMELKLWKLKLWSKEKRIDWQLEQQILLTKPNIKINLIVGQINKQKAYEENVVKRDWYRLTIGTTDSFDKARY